MRPDYCPMANEPCQSLCDKPCSAHRLKNPTPPAAPVQEPVAFFDWYDNAHWGNEDLKECCHRSWNAAIKQARALDKKAENDRALGLDYEPVGWWDAKIGFFEEKHFDQLQPLYTTPPAAQRQSARSAWVHATEWRGLTDEEIEDIVDECDGVGWDVAQAIEAKLKEKNT